MRLWSLHPKYLDTKGLLAVWREGLLAQKVLMGKTQGYRNHPQLDRFKGHPFPKAAIGHYLLSVWQEAKERGYRFTKSKVKNTSKKAAKLKVTRGQMRYEREHLGKKLKKRDPARFQSFSKSKTVAPHPLFRVVAGPVANWEKR